VPLAFWELNNLGCITNRDVMKIITGLLVLALFGMAGCSGGNGFNAPNHSITTSNAGADQNIRAMSNVTLDGSHSTGANGKLITYQWSFESTPSGSRALLSNSAVVNPTFTPDMEGTYVLSLIVNEDRKSTRLNSSHSAKSRMPSSA